MQKIYNPVMALLSGGLFLGALFAADDSVSRPVWNQATATKRTDIIQEYGAPTKTTFIEPKDMLDELRASIREKIPTGKTTVLQMTYRKDKETVYYWLVKGDKEDEWVVFSDVKIPNDVKF